MMHLESIAHVLNSVLSVQSIFDNLSMTSMADSATVDVSINFRLGSDDYLARPVPVRGICCILIDGSNTS
jgi:hypothetical protein